MPVPTRSKKALEVTELPRATPPVDATAIPAEVSLYFESKGDRLSWGSRFETAVTKAWTRGAFPVNVNTDFNDANEETRNLLINTLKAQACKVMPDGAIQRADCLLYRQSMAEWERKEQEWYENYVRNSSSEERQAFAEKMNDMIAREQGGDPLGRIEIRDQRRSSFAR